MKKLSCFLMIFMLLALFSCKDDEKVNNNPTNSDFSKGVLITHEGVYQTGTGTVSYLDPVTGLLQNEVFNKVNKRPLGNIGQSASIHNDKTYIVVNNANKMEVVNSADFKSLGTFDATTLPRHFLGISDTRGYLSQWGTNGVNGEVLVIDLSDMSLTKTIACGSGSGFMLHNGDKVYVANTGGFGNDSSVVVINTLTDALESHIEAKYNPNSMQIDANGKMWILCQGKWKADWSELEHKGMLYRVDLLSGNQELSLEFDSKFSEPKYLKINKEGTKLYYVYDGMIYQHDITATSLSTSPFISRGAYSLGLDQTNGMLYVGNAGDYVSKGYVFRFRESNAALVDSIKTGIIPTHFEFGE